VLYTAHKENPLSDSENRLFIFQGQQNENQQVLKGPAGWKYFVSGLSCLEGLCFQALRLFKQI
jgi:hypothetical protein